MITLHEIQYYLEEFLRTEEFSDYCENGLQVEGKKEIRKIGTAVTASLATIETAVKANVDALLVHHGLFWKGDSYAITGVKRKKLHLLLEHNISLLAYHLPLDAHREVGNNWRAAQEMGWSELEPFCEMNGNLLGVKGTFKALSFNEFQTQLEEYYQHPATIAAGGGDKVCSAALVSGGARRALSDAVSEGVDAFITGNFDEPEWHVAHEEGIHFFAMGHSATERIGPRCLGDHLGGKLDVEVEFLDVENPF